MGLVHETRHRTSNHIATEIASVRAAASDKRTTGAAAARSQDFLYDKNGLPK